MLGQEGTRVIWRGEARCSSWLERHEEGWVNNSTCSWASHPQADLPPSMSVSDEKLYCPQAMAKRLQSSISLWVLVQAQTCLWATHLSVGLVSFLPLYPKTGGTRPAECLSPKTLQCKHCVHCCTVEKTHTWRGTRKQKITFIIHMPMFIHNARDLERYPCGLLGTGKS